MNIQSENFVINKKSFESNKLINPDIEEDLEEDLEEDEEGSDLDDETLEIINRVRLKKLNDPNYKMFKDTNENKPEESISKINKKTKVKKSMSLQEFSKITDSESKPVNKRFTSNRVEHKKKQYDNTSITKRQFNPRKPPYNFIRKSNINNSPQLNDIQEFPNLK